MWTQGSKCVLGTEQVSNRTKELIATIQRHRKCEYVCLYYEKEDFPFEALDAAEDHVIAVGEVVAITDLPVIAEALEQAARSGLERK